MDVYTCSDSPFDRRVVTTNSPLEGGLNGYVSVCFWSSPCTAPTAVAGDGIYLIDSDGKRYLDACGGAAVSCLGHTPKRVIDRACEQLQKLAFAHTSFFTSEPAEQLANVLVNEAPTGVEHVYFVSGGSEAVEAALKLARQYFLEIGQPDRTHVIGRRQSYPGNTLGALGSGGNQWRRRQFEPLLPKHMSHISPCHYYRWAEAETPFDYGQRLPTNSSKKSYVLAKAKLQHS